MATDSPMTISSWHRHQLRKRAAASAAAASEAFNSAVYYSECSLGGISHTGAAKAEEIVRIHQSRWWLRGDDPNHPTLQSVDTNKSPSSSLNNEVLKSVHAEESVVDDSGDTNTEGHVGEAGNNNIRDEINHAAALRQDNSNSPIFVRDNDYGLSFGALANFPTERILQTGMSRSTTPTTTSSSQSTHSQQISCVEKTKSQHALLAHTTSESSSEADSKFASKSESSTSCSSQHTSRKRHRLHDNSNFDQARVDAKILTAKTKLLSTLQQEGGTSQAFKSALSSLERYSNLNITIKKRELSGISPTVHDDGAADNNNISNIDGTWRMISPPEYPSSLGINSHGERLFTLGRMSFDMYHPSDLICSIQKQYNTIHSVEPHDVPLYVPRSLIKEVADGRSEKCRGGLKTYNIIVLFTIEQSTSSSSKDGRTSDDQPKEPLRGILTNYGYALPDPTHPNRKSIWFTGGTIEPAQEHSLDEWKRIFGASNGSEQQNIGFTSTESRKPTTLAEEAEKARILASNIMLGAVHEPMDSRGVIGFHLKRPIGGHGSAYCDVIYMDEDVRVMRGHSGSIYVFKKE